MKFLLPYRLFENNSINIGDEALCINTSGDGNNLEYGKVYTIEKTRQSFGGLQVFLVEIKFFWDSDRFIFDPNEIEDWKLEHDINKYNL